MTHRKLVTLALDEGADDELLRLVLDEDRGAALLRVDAQRHLRNTRGGAGAGSGGLERRYDQFKTGGGKYVTSPQQRWTEP